MKSKFIFKNLWHTHIVEYYSAINMNELLINDMVKINPESIMAIFMLWLFSKYYANNEKTKSLHTYESMYMTFWKK